jgi:hypothetical protein
MIARVRDLIIPELNRFCAAPIIEADQTGNKPNGPHATFKFTSPRFKDIGQAEETGHYEALFVTPYMISEVYQIKRVEHFKITISITAIDEDIDGSMDLASKLHEWFDFYGSEILDIGKIAVVEKTDIQNRDVFIAEDYERRNGFDVILRVTKEMFRDAPFIQEVSNITN